MITKEQWKLVCKTVGNINSRGCPVFYMGYSIWKHRWSDCRLAFGGSYGYLDMHYPCEDGYGPSYWELKKRFTVRPEGHPEIDFTNKEYFPELNND